MLPEQLAEYQKLRARGMWREAQHFKNAERARLRAEGVCKRVANEESWRLMREKYLDASPAVMMSRMQAIIARCRAAELAADTA